MPIIQESQILHLGDITNSYYETSIEIGQPSLVLISIATANADGSMPMVKLGGSWAKPVQGATLVDSSIGSLSVYSVRINEVGSKLLRVSSLSNYSGEVSATICTITDSEGIPGRVWAQIQKDTGPAYTPPTVDLTLEYELSKFFVFGAGFYGESIPTLPTGFTLSSASFSGGILSPFIITGTPTSSTATIKTSDYIPAILIGVEVVSSQVELENPVKVQLLHRESISLGNIESSSDIFSQMVDIGTSDLLIVGVQVQYPGVYPLIEFGLETLKPISFSKVQNESYGSIGFFALKNPKNEYDQLRVIPPQDMGITNLLLFSLKSTSGDIGVNWESTQVGLHSNQLIHQPNYDSSISICIVGSFYAAGEVLFPRGWEEIGLASGERSYEGGAKSYGICGAVLTDGRYSNSSFTTESEIYLQALYSCIEIYDSSTEIPDSNIEVFSQATADFGWLAASSKTIDIELAACDLLFICMVWNSERYPPATLYIGPDQIHPIVDSDISYDNSHMQLYAVSDISEGIHSFRAQGYSEAAGQYLISMVGVNGSSGVLSKRVQAADIHYKMEFNLPSVANPNNVYLAFNSAHWQKEKPTISSYGWDTVNNQAHPNQDYNVTSYTAKSRYGALAEFLRSGFDSQKTTLLEIRAKTLSEINLIGSVSLPNEIIQAYANPITLNTEDMKVSIHWDSWGEIYASPDNPDSYFLTHLPEYVDEVTLCFMRPLCSYTGLSNNIAEISSTPFYGSPGAASIQFEGTGYQFKAVLDLLRKRNPNIVITLAIQQLAEGEDASVGMTPYSPQGFGGMETEHFLNIKKFCEDMEITSIDIVYECVVTDSDLIASGNPIWWCYYDENDVHQCYTDTEYSWVVKEFRKHFPRPTYTIKIDAWNIGAYFGLYRNEWEPYWNAGYCHCLTYERDPEAFEAFDGINIMSFDIEPSKYDPVRALEAFIHHFPGKKIKPGIRTGAAWASTPDYNRSLGEYLNLINTSAKIGGDGVWIYSLLWDLQSKSDLSQAYSRSYPSGEMKAQLAARLYNKPSPEKSLVTNGTVARILL